MLSHRKTRDVACEGAEGRLARTSHHLSTVGRKAQHRLLLSLEGITQFSSTARASVQRVHRAGGLQDQKHGILTLTHTLDVEHGSGGETSIRLVAVGSAPLRASM